MTPNSTYLEWTPERLLAWAKEVGPHTHHYVDRLMKRCPHQGFRSSLGLKRLSRSASQVHLEYACHQAAAAGVYRLKTVETLLKSQPLALSDIPAQTTSHHDNIRGQAYYTQSKETVCLPNKP